MVNRSLTLIVKECCSGICSLPLLSLISACIGFGSHWLKQLVHNKSSTASPTSAMTLFLTEPLVALLHIPVQEQIEAVPVGVMPGFALVGTAGEKRGDDVRQRCHDPCIHPAKVDPSDVLPVIYQQAFPFDPGRGEGEGLGRNVGAFERHFRQFVFFARQVGRLSHRFLPPRFRLLLPRASPLPGRITLTCAPLDREARCGFIAAAVCAAIASSCCRVRESQSLRSGGAGHHPPSWLIP